MSSLHSKTLFASFAVMAIVAVAFAGVSVASDESDAAGSGTQSSPFSGSLVGDFETYNRDLYITVGTSISMSPPQSYSMMGLSITDGYGLSIDSSKVITGTVSKTGTVTISFVDEYDSSQTAHYYWYIVSSESDIDFTSPSAVDAISGSSVSYQATTNISGVTFSKDGGNASWLTITSSGKLTGTAPSVTSETDYTFIIKATSSGGQTATQTVTFTIFPVAKLTVTSTSVSGTVGSSIGLVKVTSNLGCTFSISGSLPAGLTHSNGVISGTPTEAGTSTVTVSGYVTEGPSQTATIQLTFSISEAALSITSQPPTGVYKVGSSYSYSLSANQSVTWELVGAPDWLTVSGGKVVGSVPTSYDSEIVETFQVKATTSGGQTATQNVSISIEPVLEFTSVPTASCVVTPVYEYDADGNFSFASVFGSFMTLGFDELDAEVSAVSEDEIDYTAPDAVDAITGASFTYNAATNITGTTYSKVSGADWLSVTSAGLVSGTAPSVSQVSDSQIVIRATSPKGQTIDQTVTITVYPVAQLTSSALSTQVHQNSLMATITVTSNVDVAWSIQGTLPVGVTFSNGVFSGTPTGRGTFPITVLGSSIAGPAQTASVKVTIVVGEPVLQITSVAPTGFYKVGQQYSYTPAANVEGIVWSISGSDVTDWLAVSDGSVIGQVPSKYTDAATATYTLKAVSPEGQEVTQSVSISIEPIIEWTSIPTAACVVQPVYDYADDGTYTPTASLMSLFMVQELDADTGDSNENAAITETGTRTFKFTWTGENAERVVWDFGDGTTGEGFSVIHTYESNGTYTYVCTGINSLGESSVTGTITVDMDSGFDYSMIVLIVLVLLVVIIFAVIISRRKDSKKTSIRRH